MQKGNFTAYKYNTKELSKIKILSKYSLPFHSLIKYNPPL